jgi:hypothetical protein
VADGTFDPDSVVAGINAIPPGLSVLVSFTATGGEMMRLAAPFAMLQLVSAAVMR